MITQQPCVYTQSCQSLTLLSVHKDGQCRRQMCSNHYNYVKMLIIEWSRSTTNRWYDECDGGTMVGRASASLLGSSRWVTRIKTTPMRCVVPFWTMQDWVLCRAWEPPCAAFKATPPTYPQRAWVHTYAGCLHNLIPRPSICIAVLNDSEAGMPWKGDRVTIHSWILTHERRISHGSMSSLMVAQYYTLMTS